ncbi:hypothetical protein SDRG_16728 [Saprolegnia diclina VS20]|uniref:Uncharacterized protein n=1 Tax=Saprolegnia diclina (strain VS20) TaxID=1156394 RepID=T0PT43_SAPDV|nr:hypothetical protein SDRG_16728 [Saprolegnia diclina VS20]EQC25401.1 hypothetical protein SDRG_16728 [Saprolegnia diclina VS20]|eukprot:XP_008621168.1 hypothetical protein SDRG_16728 [Saprolegnia diclina VS20]
MVNDAKVHMHVSALRRGNYFKLTEDEASTQRSRARCSEPKPKKVKAAKAAESSTPASAAAATSQDELIREWFPAPDLTANLDDEEGFENAMRHNSKFSMADALKIYSEVQQPPCFREALGPCEPSTHEHRLCVPDP